MRAALDPPPVGRLEAPLAALAPQIDAAAGMNDRVYTVDVAVALSRPPHADRWRSFIIAAGDGTTAELVACQWAESAPTLTYPPHRPVMAVESVVTNWSTGGTEMPDSTKHPDAGQPFVSAVETPWGGPGVLPGFLVGECGHKVARSEWTAGYRVCEHCPAGGDPEATDPPDSTKD